MPQTEKKTNASQLICLQCKKCGASIQFCEGQAQGICEYCGNRVLLTSVSEQPASVLLAQTEALLKHAFMNMKVIGWIENPNYRENSMWKRADELLEQVLIYDPNNAKAYIGKLMVRLQVNMEENLPKRAFDLSRFSEFQKAIQFADTEYKATLKEYQRMANMQLTMHQKMEARKRNTKLMQSLIDAEKKAKDLHQEKNAIKKKVIVFSIITCVCTVLSLITDTPGVYIGFAGIALIFGIGYGIMLKITNNEYLGQEKIISSMRDALQKNEK